MFAVCRTGHVVTIRARPAAAASDERSPAVVRRVTGSSPRTGRRWACRSPLRSVMQAPWPDTPPAADPDARNIGQRRLHRRRFNRGRRYVLRFWCRDAGCRLLPSLRLFIGGHASSRSGWHRRLPSFEYSWGCRWSWESTLGWHATRRGPFSACLGKHRPRHHRLIAVWGPTVQPSSSPRLRS